MKEIVTDIDQLSIRCEEIDVRKENQLMREIIVELKDTIRNTPNSVGLAANQIGYNKRIFCINFSGDIRSFINPIITEVKGFGLSREGCLSLPGKEYIRPRHNEISVVYQTPLGKTESRKLIGRAAEVFQHELDHLDGLLLSDIGFEIPENYDSLSEDDKAKLIQRYMDSLDIKQKQIHEEINADKDLKETEEAIDFMKAVQSGQVEFGDQVTKTRKNEE